MPKEILDKQVGIDLDGDKKPDIKLDVKSIAIVLGFIISGTMSYNNLKNEIEIAKELPVYEIKTSAEDLIVKQNIEYLQKEIDNLEEKVKDLENKVYKK